MENLKDLSIHLTAEKLTEELKNMKIYPAFYQDLQRLVSSPNVTKEDFKNSLLSAMKNCSMETTLRNHVFHWLRSHKNQGKATSQTMREPLAYLRKAQIQWEKRIHKSLNSMANEIKVNFASVRSPQDMKDLEEKWKELSTYAIELSPYRPVYAAKDFLEVLLWLRNPNYKSSDLQSSWEFVHLPLRVKSLPELRAVYVELARGEAMLGVDPHIQTGSNFPSLIAERTALGYKVLQCNHAPVTQEFLKRGAPRSLRAKLWAQVMGTEIKPHHVKYFTELKQMVLRYDLMIDKLIIKDVQLTASNDHQYFVFEDLLYQVLLCFSRDAEVTEVFRTCSSSPIYALLKNKSGSIDNTVFYPPSGVIPFHGFTMYATPFCYLYDDEVALYYIFRGFYMRYWYRLHEVSSSEQSILCLCLLFERLLQRYEQALWIHFRTIGVQPIRVAFKWIMRSFSGYLPPEQVLYLWDLVLAYDSLEIIPLLAVCIISFRRNNLLLVDNLNAVEQVLLDLSSIQVMPLLQMVLIEENKSK